MQAPEPQQVVVTVLSGHATSASRSFCWPEVPPPLSVGSQGDWSVSAPGVASIHLWLQFDGQRLYAASAGAGAPITLRGTPLGPGWNDVADGAELCFGQARLRARYERALVSAPAPEPAHERPLSPLERAAAVPLPSYFTDRRRAGSSARARDAAPDGPEAHGSQRSRMRRLALLLPLIVLALMMGGVWLAHSNLRMKEPTVAAPVACSTVLPPAPTFSEVPRQESPPLAPPPLAPPPLAPPPLAAPAPAPLPVEPPVVALPAGDESFAPTESQPSRPLKAYPQNVANKPVPRIGEQPWMISEAWRARHERQLHASNRTRSRVLFLGDSITEAWGMSPAYKDRFGKYEPLNLGLSGDLTQNVLWRIEQGALAGARPGLLVLMIGVNNLAGGFAAEATIEGVRAILAAVQSHLPQTPVLLLAILPAKQDPTDPLRQRITQANQLLAKLAEPPRVGVHDFGQLLLEPDGTISNTIMRDFLHPTPLGYERLSEAVAPLVEARLGRAAE